MRRNDHCDMARWDACQRCGDFDGCYKFSMAKLAMEAAIQKR